MYEKANSLNASQQRLDQSFTEAESIEGFKNNVTALLMMDRSESHNWPQSLLTFQNQALKFFLNNGLPEEWKKWVDLSEVSDPKTALKSETAVNTSHIARFFQSSFFPERASPITEDEEIRKDFEAYLEKISHWAIRCRDEVKVIGEAEKQRIRIVTDTWQTIYSGFNETRLARNKSTVSAHSLRKIHQKYLPQFRRASKRDRAYALCSCCSQFNALHEVILKNSVFDEWNITNEDLLKLSVCGDDEKCVWSHCGSCNRAATKEKVIASIPNYEVVKEEMVEYALLVDYRAKESSKTKTSIWVNQYGTVAEFVDDLIQSMFVHKTKSTGEKVRHKEIESLSYFK